MAQAEDLQQLLEALTSASSPESLDSFESLEHTLRKTGDAFRDGTLRLSCEWLVLLLTQHFCLLP